MKISEVLEAYNKAIDSIREDKNIESKGHFIAVEDIKKSMGPYKQFYVTILYHNMDSNVNYPFAGAQMMERCPAGTEDAALTRVELEALKKFFEYCHNPVIFESILSNSYERTR